MPTSRYSLTEGSIAAHASRLDTTHNDLNTTLQQFSSALSGLPGAWKGASFTSFNEVQTRWHNAGRELDRALQDIRSRVAGSAAIYDAGQAEQAQAMRQVGQSVDWSAGTFRG